MEVLEDGFASSSPLLGGEFVGHMDGLIEVAQFVEEATLLLGIEVDSAQGRAQAAATVVNDQLQAVLASNPLSLQETEKGDPFLSILTVAQMPEHYLTAVRFWPHAQGNEGRTLESTFDSSFSSFTIPMDLTIRSQHVIQMASICKTGGTSLGFQSGISSAR
jgi:hypothetical protein